METLTISREDFTALTKAVIAAEKILREHKQQESAWVSEEQALQMLGCAKRHLGTLKAQGKIAYKAVGKKHQYSRKSIDQYNKLMSTL